MIFQSSTMSSAHSTLKNAKNLAKNEEIFTSQKLKFAAKLFKENAILSREITPNLSFLAKNQNTRKMQPIVCTYIFEGHLLPTRWPGRLEFYCKPVVALPPFLCT